MKNARLLTNDELLEVLRTTWDAFAIHVGEDAVIQYANDAMLAFWGKGTNVIGKSLEGALPELKGQPFIEMFKRAWNEGITFKGTDTPADIQIDGSLQTFYFDYEYRAVKNDKGETYCILHMAKDVTELVLSKEREQNLNEELRALNEELLSANEEMNTSNEELTESRAELFNLYDELSISNDRFRTIVRQMPVGICIIRANDLYVENVNDAYLELVGKNRQELENKTIWEAVPEAAEVYAPIMNAVIDTGIPFTAKEHELVLIKHGNPEIVFVDFVYEPIKIDGKVNAINVLAIDVTGQVKTRRSVEDMEERVRLAVEAAEIGTFDLDLTTNEMVSTDRFDYIFGFDNSMARERYINAIHPDDMQIRNEAHKAAIKDGRLFYEARVIHPDQSIHWIRAQGKVYYDNDKPIRLLGTLLDITQFKRLEQQKDDFISIASHELKTPITSLKASLQLLDKLKVDLTSPLVPRLIDQSTKSMQKINSLVEELLNVSRTQASQLKLNKAWFNVHKILDSCCNHVRVEGKYHLITEGDKDLMVFADEHAIDQVMVNLVNNAVKYAPESLDILLTVEREGDMAKISVTDNGPGIDPEKIPHLFERYYQGQSDGFNNSGLGLGLYICSEIIRKHGGEIGVISENGKGSIFWFTLPLN